MNELTGSIILLSINCCWRSKSQKKIIVIWQKSIALQKHVKPLHIVRIFVEWFLYRQIINYLSHSNILTIVSMLLSVLLGYSGKDRKVITSNDNRRQYWYQLSSQLFLYWFLLIADTNQYQAKIDLDCYWLLSIYWMTTPGSISLCVTCQIQINSNTCRAQ